MRSVPGEQVKNKKGRGQTICLDWNITFIHSLESINWLDDIKDLFQQK